MSIILTFEQGTDPDIAQVQVQNKLQLATPLLPEEVQRQGIRVAKYQSNFMLVVGLVDESGRMSAADLSDYIATNFQDPISRTEGVGDFMLFGSQYAMRIRSEEHTSELQSLMRISYAVFCLKKNTHEINN